MWNIPIPAEVYHNSILKNIQEMSVKSCEKVGGQRMGRGKETNNSLTSRATTHSEMDTTAWRLCSISVIAHVWTCFCILFYYFFFKYDSQLYHTRHNTNNYHGQILDKWHKYQQISILTFESYWPLKGSTTDNKRLNGWHID